MIRNLPSVRSSQPHHRRGDLALDKENVDIPASYKTPGRLGKADRTTFLKATFQTPAAKGAPLSAAKFTHGPLALKTPHHEPNKPTYKTPFLGENGKPLPTAKKDKPISRLGLRDITHETPFQKSNSVQPDQNDSAKPKSRRASAKKAGRVTLKSPVVESQQANVVQPAKVAAGEGAEIEEVEEVEYMPPSTYELDKYKPDYDFTIEDLKILAEPQLDVYIDAATWEAVNRNDLPEFVPDLTCGMGFDLDVGLHDSSPLIIDEDLSGPVTPLFNDFVLEMRVC
ncbi:hypothetical protein HK097_009600 [Rhizophlyctis rosea]|uniref:Securin n=1 Tax=Rhizophlyctis rosea TaxID=64517 RepID=A0AAD5SHS7_9FUNG|nr:hypothetical protein HK097_009600 [Rhizophlyctis rosea]